MWSCVQFKTERGKRKLQWALLAVVGRCCFAHVCQLFTQLQSVSSKHHLWFKSTVTTFCRQRVLLFSPSPSSLASFHCTCQSSWWAVNLETASGLRLRESVCVKVSQASQKQTLNTSAFIYNDMVLWICPLFAEGKHCFFMLFNMTLALSSVLFYFTSCFCDCLISFNLSLIIIMTTCNLLCHYLTQESNDVRRIFQPNWYEGFYHCTIFFEDKLMASSFSPPSPHPFPAPAVMQHDGLMV